MAANEDPARTSAPPSEETKEPRPEEHATTSPPPVSASDAPEPKRPSFPAQKPEKRASIPSASPEGTEGARARAASVSPEAAEGGPLGAYEAVARSARLPDLVAITRRVVAEAAHARRSAWNALSTVATAAEEAKLTRADVDTPYGNALKVLQEGPEGEAERALASALWAHALAESKRDDEDLLAGDVLWLATHTPFDATPLLDRALGEDADALWKAIADRVRRIADGKGAALGRAEALVGCAALASTSNETAVKARAELANKLGDPTFRRLLATAGDANLGEVRFEGEAIAAPRGPVATTLLALTGILFAVHAVRLVARLALAYKRPAEVSLSDAGIRVKTRTQMLGRTLRDREQVIARSALVRVVREVRYPRAAFYAGLLALAVGSYIGVRAFVDGVRSASPSLLLVGLFVVAAGIAADFVLGSLLPGARGRVRVAFVPRSGATVCVADVDASRADQALSRALRMR